MDESARTLAYRYARALLLGCKDSQSLQQIASQLHCLCLSYTQDNRVLKQLMNNPTFSIKQRLHVVELLEQRLGLQKDLARFLRLLVQRDRIRTLPQIASAFSHLKEVQEGSLRARVTSAQLLPEDQRNQLTTLLQNTLGKQVLLQCKQDASVLAGIRIYAGGFVFDATLKGRLEALRKRLFTQTQQTTKSQARHER